MRIAVLMSLAGPWQRETAGQLAELGHRVEVIALDRLRGTQYLSVDDPFQRTSIDKLRGSVDGVHILKTRSSGEGRYLTSARRLGQLARELQADVLLTLYGGGHALMAYASGFRPYAVYVVGSDVLLARSFRRSLGRMALTAATAVFVNGRFLTERTRALAPRAHIVPVYLGVDTSLFAPGTPPPAPVRIICTRGFAPIYNNEYLIEGLAAMPAVGVEFIVTFLAGGPSLDAAMALADRLLPPQLRQRVAFEGGASRERVVAALRGSHVYVSLSRSDGTSVSLMEALACGLFPVLSDIPPNREWMHPEGGNGALVPLDDPATLGAALAQAVSDSELRGRATVRNLQLAAERVDRRRNMAFLASALKEAMNDRLHVAPGSDVSGRPGPGGPGP